MSDSTGFTSMAGARAEDDAPEIGVGMLGYAALHQRPADQRHEAQTTRTSTVSLPVEGMSCGSCASKVKRTLKDIKGVGDAVVDLGERNVTVEYDPRELAPDRLVGAINGLGYKAGAPAEAAK